MICLHYIHEGLQCETRVIVMGSQWGCPEDNPLCEELLWFYMHNVLCHYHQYYKWLSDDPTYINIIEYEYKPSCMCKSNHTVS